MTVITRAWAVMARAWAVMARAWAVMARAWAVIAKVMADTAKAWGGILRCLPHRRWWVASAPPGVGSDRLANIWAPARPPRDVAISACHTSFPTRSTTRL